jgi:hypothetical protein
MALSGIDTLYKSYDQDLIVKIKKSGKNIRFAAVFASFLGLIAYSPKFGWLQIDFSNIQSFLDAQKLSVVLFVIGESLLSGGYFDLMRGNRNGFFRVTLFNVLTEAVGGILMVVFYIWSFFVFDWWVPLILCTIFGGLLSAFIKFKILNFPQLHIIIGAPLCLLALW